MRPAWIITASTSGAGYWIIRIVDAAAWVPAGEPFTARVTVSEVPEVAVMVIHSESTRMVCPILRSEVEAVPERVMVVVPDPPSDPLDVSVLVEVTFQ